MTNSLISIQISFVAKIILEKSCWIFKVFHFGILDKGLQAHTARKQVDFHLGMGLMVMS